MNASSFPPSLQRLLLFAALLCIPMGSFALEHNEVAAVARFQSLHKNVAAINKSQSVLLEAIVPLPRGFWRMSDQTIPLTAYRNGVPLETEMHILSRYSGNSPHSSIATSEVIFELPADSIPRQEEESFDVELRFDPKPIDTSRFNIPSRDIFRLEIEGVGPEGQTYTTGPLEDYVNLPSTQIVQEGKNTRTYKFSTTMVPQGAAIAGRLLGAIVWVTAYNNRAGAKVEVMLHNSFYAPVGTHPTNFRMGDSPVFVKQIDVCTPRSSDIETKLKRHFEGRSRIEGSRTCLRLIEPLADDKLHPFRPRQNLTRRFTLFRRSSDGRESRLQRELRAISRLENMGFAIKGFSSSGSEYFSYHNEETSTYLPAGIRVPGAGNESYTNAARARVEEQLRMRIWQNETGEANPLTTDDSIVAAGPFHSVGQLNGQQTGPYEITTTPGISAILAGISDGIELYEIVADRRAERQLQMILDAEGENITAEQWEEPAWSCPKFSPQIGNRFELSEKYWENADNSHHIVFEQNRVAPYYDYLKSVFTVGLSHLSRTLSPVLVHAWLTNDHVSKFRIESMGLMFQMAYSELPSSRNCNYQGLLKLKQEEVANDPGNGVSVGRAVGWGKYALGAAYQLMKDPQGRSKVSDYMKKWVDLIQQGQNSCTHVIQKTNWHSYGIEFIAQIFEEYYVHQALRTTYERVFYGQDEEYEEKTYALLFSIGAALAQDSSPYWNPIEKQYKRKINVSPDEQPENTFCGDFPLNEEPQENQHAWPALAYNLRQGGPAVALEKIALSMGLSENFTLEQIYNQLAQDPEDFLKTAGTHQAELLADLEDAMGM